MDPVDTIYSDKPWNFSTLSRRPEKRSVDAAEISDSGNESDFIDEGYESLPEENQRRARGHKRARTSLEPDPDFVENNLYIALSNSEFAVSDLALEWVEQWMSDFESNKSEATTEVFNLVLRCCGCFHLDIVYGWNCVDCNSNRYQ